MNNTSTRLPGIGTDKTPSSRTRLLLPFLILLLLSGCATTYPTNPPLSHIDPDHDAGYTFQDMTRQSDKGDQVLLMLAFSGGGTRAAAFSYGVLKELSRTELGQEGHKSASRMKWT
jgi:NTE family protein